MSWLLLHDGCPEYGRYYDTFELADCITGYDADVAVIHEVEDILLNLPLGVIQVVWGTRVVRVEWRLGD